MQTFFCSQESRQVGEDPIATADHCKTHILIECPPPWATDAIDSKLISESLQALYQEIQEANLSANLLFIYSKKLIHKDTTRCIIYSQEEYASKGYSKKEFIFPDIASTVPLLREYLFTGHFTASSIETQTRDILVCTHGSQDICCARYGKPFYNQAINLVADLSLDSVRVWQVSHIGGHRFAPTIIDFPECRYYARLDQNSFASILTRTGDISYLKNTYRGWGLLPYPVQALERDMIFQYGWEWFDYKIDFQLIEQEINGSWVRVKLNFQNLNGEVRSVQADVFEDEEKAVYLIGDCSGTELEKITQYSIKNLVYI
ncbi:sucrase ferredoxin [Nostoc sp. HG1]|nr:sucrase ferredoxin [Nostoc sp. HG1]MCL6750032.1 sucrase ferredoxin [Nostoc sp. CCCryo 231-06]